MEIQAQGDQDLQNVTVDLHLWRKQNSSFQLMKRFPMMIFNITVRRARFFVLSANVSEEQFYFNEGDILGFEIPANVPINVTSSPSPEPICHEKNMTYLLSANCCNCTPDSSVCDEPRIRIRIGEFAVYILKKCKRNSTAIFKKSISGSPSSSVPLPMSSPTPSTSSSAPSSKSSPTPSTSSSAPSSKSSPTPSPAGPTSPTSSQLGITIFIIIGATLVSTVCAMVMIVFIVLVICILQRRTQSTVWRHSNETDFKFFKPMTMH